MSPGAMRFLEQVADAYRSSPLEVLGIILVVLVLLGGLIAYATIWGRREKRQSTELSRQLYDQKSRELKLTQEHHDLLAKMAAHLKDPARIHQLVTEEVAFNAAALHLRENQEATPQEISSLRFALGYQAGRNDRAPKSSTQIPEGATVLVARNRYKKPIKAKVRAPEARWFLITLVDEDARVPEGAGVDIYFQNSAGVYTFHTSVVEEKGKDIKLHHTEEIKLYQKRQYYRRRIDLPVTVYPFDAEKPIPSRFRDIGGGGASLLNTNRHFKVGDDLELRFRPDKEEEIRLTGSVMRLSEDGAVMHVNYEHIRDGLRDRIYSAIFRPPKDEQEAAERGAVAGDGRQPNRPPGTRPRPNPSPDDQGTKTTP